jgi:hypothetical protein
MTDATLNGDSDFVSEATSDVEAEQQTFTATKAQNEAEHPTTSSTRGFTFEPSPESNISELKFTRDETLESICAGAQGCPEGVYSDTKGKFVSVIATPTQRIVLGVHGSLESAQKALRAMKKLKKESNEMAFM